MAARAFGRSIVVRPLTGQGLVEVFEARDPQLERRVAVKVIHRPAFPDTEFDERFRHEARLIAALRHSHIVQVYDFGVADGLLYMVMEYLEGGTFAERLAEHAARGERMALPEAVHIFEPLADALDAAHGQGIVHGALSPANILFTARGQPVLTDFGSAQTLGQLSLTNLTVIGGAPAYVSPEQASGKPLDARSDVYSLGAILYEVVTGSPPFVGDSPAGVMLQHVTEPAPSPERSAAGLPQGVAGVLGRALAKDPAARYGSARELVRAFAAAVRGEPVSVQGEKLPTGEVPGWVKPLAGAAELLAPLIGRQAPAVNETARDRRGLVATILGMLGILLAALQFAVAALDLVTRSLARVAMVLPYLIGILLAAAAVLSVYWGWRAPSRGHPPDQPGADRRCVGNLDVVQPRPPAQRHHYCGRCLRE